MISECNCLPYSSICTLIDLYSYLTAGALDGRQLAQLQILYKARGNKLEEMTKDFDQYKAETSREIRILKHQISLAKGKNTRYH